MRNACGRKKTWIRWKNNSQTYLCIQKWSTRSVSSNFRTEVEINPLESDFYHPTHLPSGISWASDLPTPSKFPIPSMVGVWIFSGTTQYILKIREHRTIYTVSQVWTPQGFLFSAVLGPVYLLNWSTVCDKISAKPAESSWVNKLYVALG